MCTKGMSFCTMMLLVLICSSQAQQALPGSQEVRLSDASAPRFTRPWISMNARGEALVLWDGGRAWVDANVERLQRAVPGPEIRCLFGLHDTTWFGLLTRSTMYNSNWVGGESVHRFARGVGTSILDSTSVVLTSAYMESRMEPGEFTSRQVPFLDGYLHDSTVFLATHVRHTSSSTGLDRNTNEHRMQQWNPILRKVSELHSNSYPPGPYYGGVRGDTLPVLARVSHPVGNALSLYWRTGPEGALYMQSIQYLQRFLCVIDLPSGTRQPQIMIDSVRSDSLDLSDQVLAPEGATVDIIRRNTITSQLFVERLNMIDGSRERHTVTGAVRVHDVTHAGNDLGPDQPAHCDAQADYVFRRLGDGRRLLVWCAPAPAGRYDIFACVYDKDWRVLGAVKRVNLDTTGRKVFPSVAVAGSRVYVAWQDTRHQRIDTYMRGFDLDQLTSEASAPAPSVLHVDGPWPQPASSQIQFTVHAPVGTTSMQLRLYDPLGRLVISEQRALENIHHHSLDLRHLRAGHYTFVLTAGASRITRPMLLLH